jgi:c-di-GMP-binding flagellar brake protein YcgR
MADEAYQDITDRRSLLEIFQELIDVRTVITMEYPGTQYNWITFILEIRHGNIPCLLVDRVRGFRTALERNPQREIFFEFKDRNRVPFAFKTDVIEFREQGIVVRMPTLVQRNQRRKYFRVETPPGAEVRFVDVLGEEDAGVLMNLGGGGIAFLLKKQPALSPGLSLNGLRLEIPDGKKTFSFRLPEVMVKRIEKWDFDKVLVALEFIEMPEGIRKDVIGYVFERQRSIIRKIGH